MYNIKDYGQMIADDVRIGAYARALKRTVGPESVVLDIGAGTGIFSLLACQYGAHKVYAIETNDAIFVAERIAQANGFADRIEFIQGLSTEIDLPEKVNVIVSDIRGALIPFQQQFLSIADARRRMLAPRGVLIPQRDSLWAALVEAPLEYDKIVAPWSCERFNLNMDAARHIVTNSWTKAVMTRDQLLGEPQCWATIDYATVDAPNVDGAITFQVVRDGIAHGLFLWFDAELIDGVGLSNAPGEPELVYGSGFFPWNSPVPLETGDTVAVRLRANLSGNDYVWSWESQVYGRHTRHPKAHFRQSTFWGAPISPRRLQKRSGGYRPTLGGDGQIDQFILSSMDGATANEDIAHALMRKFPLHFSSLAVALTRIGDISERYSGETIGKDAGCALSRPDTTPIPNTGS